MRLPRRNREAPSAPTRMPGSRSAMAMAMAMLMMSPSERNLACAAPTPSGVPVKMRSTVVSVVIEER